MGTSGKIASAGSNHKKNEILWADGLGLIVGAAGGVLASVAVGALVVSGPVGWGVALVASAAGGFFAQKAGETSGKFLYDQFGNQMDLLSATGVGQLCR